MTLLGRAVLRTLVYADIFSYPLKASEVERWLISQKPRFGVQKELAERVKDSRLVKKGNYYCLPGREAIVDIRKEREISSNKKFMIAKRLSRLLNFLPTVRMVAVTGSLAMTNTEEEEDIDLLIITAKNRIWLTRLAVILLTEIVAKRRRPKEKAWKNKICLNMFLEEDKLCVVPEERNLFTAHEGFQVYPLSVKGDIYQKFIKENEWCKRFLPNWKPLPASAN